MIARNLRNTILTADITWGLLAMPLAYLGRYGWVWRGPTDRTALIFVPPLLTALLLWSVMSSWGRLDGFRTGGLFPAVIAQLVLSVSVLMSAVFTLAYLMREFISRLALGYFGILLFLGFLAIRMTARSLLISRRSRGMVRNIVIVGSGPLAREMVNKIECHPELLCKIVGFLSPGEETLPPVSTASRTEAVVLGTRDVAEMLKAQGVDEIILTLGSTGHPEVVDLTSRCAREGIAVSMVPQPYELYLTKPELSDLDGLPLLQLQPVTLEEPAWKRPFDVILTLALLPMCIPLMLGAAALLKVRTGRAFCRERRCGKFGKEFLIYRLCCPRVAVNLPQYERFLQRLSLTELPQLFNVLHGEMSLVGPRPEGLDRSRRYTDWHRQRLNAKPGITGLAQVHGLRDQHSSEDKTRYDLQYILHRSPFQDISLLLQTGWTLLRRMIIPQKVEVGGQGTSPVAGSVAVDLNFQETFVHAHSSQSSAD